ncbi:MAG: hypothetical protein H7A23_26870 [Leptospiraceae bacterium]|nr:hypothetical protein [Leptospiraceae bacterium]MCP5498194.1 hypothetical protein [Leptospiraceae bacterium]
MKLLILILMVFSFLGGCISVPKFEENLQSVECFYKQKEIEWEGDKRYLYHTPTLYFVLLGAFAYGFAFVESVALPYSAIMFFIGEIRVYRERQDWKSRGCNLKK